MSSPANIRISGSALPPTRLPGLDWLRAGACLLVVLLHAGIPYMTSPLPGLVWCTEDVPARSVFVDGMCWGIDTFVMPLFFLMGGFLACQSCDRAGPIAFTRNRTLRLGLPFAFAVLFVLPLDFYVWLLGWVGEERVAPRALRSLKVGAELRAQLAGPGHLWFLQYLWIFCAYAGLLAYWKSCRTIPDRATIPIRSHPTRLGRPAAIGGLFAIAVGGLAWDPRVVIGFEQAILPTLARLAFYGPCFALGWLWNRWRWQPGRRTALGLLGAAATIFPAIWLEVVAHVAEPATGWRLFALVLSFAACGWLGAAGLFGAGLSLARPAPRLVADFARVSLWVYLVHHPVVGLTQVSLRAVDLPGEFKCLIVFATALGTSILTYRAFVRGRKLDEWLNGVEKNPAVEADVRRRAA